MKQISEAVIAYARDKYGMRLKNSGRTQNFINFEQDDTFAINKTVMDGMYFRFPGSSLNGKIWQVPIDATKPLPASSSRGRSESPSRSTFTESRYHLKMIIFYILTISIVIALKFD